MSPGMAVRVLIVVAPDPAAQASVEVPPEKLKESFAQPTTSPPSPLQSSGRSVLLSS